MKDYTDKDIGKAAVMQNGAVLNTAELEKKNLSTGKPTRLFVDMDGTLAVFKNVDTLETLYEKGYFENLEPHKNVVDAIKNIILNNNVEVFIMSSVLSDSKYALEEKNTWLDKYLPEVDKSHRIFPPCGEEKAKYVPLGIKDEDLLLDDYTKNLLAWEPPAVGVKLLNDKNNTHGTWQGAKVEFKLEPQEIQQKIENIINMKKKEPKNSQWQYTAQPVQMDANDMER